MRQVRKLGLLGTGVIGGGWAARALHFGIDVVAADVKPEMEEWIRGAVANAEGALARLTIAPLPPKGKLTFTTDLKAMARAGRFHSGEHPRAARAETAGAGAGQPRGAARRRYRVEHLGTHADRPAARHAGAGASSGRHPFNPVYLLPLVELVAGRTDGAGTLSRRAQFYTLHRHASLDACAAKCRATSPIGCRRRCGARSCTWSTRTLPLPASWTTRSSTGPACAGPPWVPTSSITSPAGNRECVTCCGSSGRA